MGNGRDDRGCSPLRRSDGAARSALPADGRRGDPLDPGGADRRRRRLQRGGRDHDGRQRGRRGEAPGQGRRLPEGPSGCRRGREGPGPRRAPPRQPGPHRGRRDSRGRAGDVAGADGAGSLGPGGPLGADSARGAAPGFRGRHHRLRNVGPGCGGAPGSGGHSLRHAGEERRSRRHLVREPLSRRAGRFAEPQLHPSVRSRLPLPVQFLPARREPQVHAVGGGPLRCTREDILRHRGESGHLGRGRAGLERHRGHAIRQPQLEVQLR